MPTKFSGFGPMGRGWIEERKTEEGIKFVAKWKRWVPDDTSPAGRKAVNDGFFELGLKVKRGPDGSLKSRKDAEDKWATIRDSVMGRTSELHPVVLRDRTFREYTVDVWEKARKDGWKETTADQWKWKKKRLLDQFGDKTMLQMETAEMQRWLNELAAAGRSKDFVQHALIYLRAILQYAVEHKVLDINPATDLRMPECKEVQRPFLSLANYERLVVAMPTFRDKLMVQILYLCAVRRRELFGLQMQDFDGETLNVERQWSERYRKMLSVKTRASKGRVEVPEQLRKDIADWKKFTNMRPEAWMFESRRAIPINSKNWLERTLRPAAVKAEIGYISYHMFRRGFATEMHEAGATDKSIQGQMRHTNPNVSRNIYMQTIRASQAGSVNVLEKAGKALGSVPPPADSQGAA